MAGVIEAQKGLFPLPAPLSQILGFGPRHVRGKAAKKHHPRGVTGLWASCQAQAGVIGNILVFHSLFLISPNCCTAT